MKRPKTPLHVSHPRHIATGQILLLVLQVLLFGLAEFVVEVGLVLALGAAPSAALALYALIAVGAVGLADVMHVKLVRLSSSAQLLHPLRFVTLLRRLL